MIKDIQLNDFISHKDTHLEFGRGLTIFVGHNGSGKSSVIDAITYALFGKHTRKSNKNLIRRAAGSHSAMVRMRFTLNSKEFQVTRTTTESGMPAFSQFELVSESGKTVNKKIAGGERRQYGESMSAEVAKAIGLDYEKLRVAAVVQQGELVRIIEAQPKEFKELINGLIGIDRLDSAYQTMLEVIRGFRDRLRDETGYTDEDIPKVLALAEQKAKELVHLQSTYAEFEDEKRMLEERVSQLESKIESMEPAILQVHELQTRESMLVRHVNDKRNSIEAEAARTERIAREARNSLKLLEGREEVSIRLQMVNSEMEDIQSRLVEIEGASGQLRGFLECAGRLKIQNGRCPVCNSPVQKINDMFDTSHIRAEITEKEVEKSNLQKSKLDLTKEQRQLAEQDKRIASAEKFLADNSISLPDQVLKLEQELESRRSDLAKLPKEISKIEDPMILAIDDVSRSLAKEILALRERVRGFSHRQYTDAKLEKSSLSQKLLDVNRKLGSYQKSIEDAKNTVDSSNEIIGKLQAASEFAGQLERVRSLIFNRDGMVGISLRSWALKMVSDKASEYASLFNIGVSRIELAEKAREITITCYGRHGEIDMPSLSGGEKVAVALAIRLGIAYMMGSNRLDFVVLDEPTTHLDEERRKALVKIISEAFREGAGPLSQMIMITHDSEIFEDSEVDQIFRFTMTSEGSQVTRE